jgi:transcriptional regulator with XRE-family HTH domain
VQPDDRRQLLRAFGATVRRTRLGRGMSQESLADEVGIHRTYVGDVERGLRNVCLLNLVRISRALDVRLGDLLKDVDDATQEHGGG